MRVDGLSQRELARRLIGSYATIRTRPNPQRGHPFDLELRVHLIGAYSGATMARYLAALMAVPPNEILVRSVRRNWSWTGGRKYRNNGVRPSVMMTWRGRHAERLLDWAGAWEAKDHPRLRAWRRWRQYREASSWRRPSGTSSPS